jgi:hypothetical protein
MYGRRSSNKCFLIAHQFTAWFPAHDCTAASCRLTAIGVAQILDTRRDSTGIETPLGHHSALEPSGEGPLYRLGLSQCLPRAPATGYRGRPLVLTLPRCQRRWYRDQSRGEKDPVHPRFALASEDQKAPRRIIFGCDLPNKRTVFGAWNSHGKDDQEGSHRGPESLRSVSTRLLRAIVG